MSNATIAASTHETEKDVVYSFARFFLSVARASKIVPKAVVISVQTV